MKSTEEVGPLVHLQGYIDQVAVETGVEVTETSPDGVQEKLIDFDWLIDWLIVINQFFKL